MPVYSNATTLKLGLPGFVLLDASHVDGELEQTVETMASVVGCTGCGTAAMLHDRRAVRVRDLPRPAGGAGVAQTGVALRRVGACELDVVRAVRADLGSASRSGRGRCSPNVPAAMPAGGSAAKGTPSTTGNGSTPASATAHQHKPKTTTPPRDHRCGLKKASTPTMDPHRSETPRPGRVRATDTVEASRPDTARYRLGDACVRHPRAPPPYRPSSQYVDRCGSSIYTERGCRIRT